MPSGTHPATYAQLRIQHQSTIDTPRRPLHRLKKRLEVARIFAQRENKVVAGSIKRYLNDYATADMHLAHTAIRNYTVAKGDTLYTLAKRFNTQIHRIKQLSGINTNTIHVRQVLKVPIMR